MKGLKLYEGVFTDNELSKLSDFVNELRVAGQNGELAGAHTDHSSQFASTAVSNLVICFQYN